MTEVPVGPVHDLARRCRWSTVNAEEAFPGLVLPLTWSFFKEPTRRTMVQLWKDLGALPRSHPVEYADVDDGFVGVFYGRCAMNVDLYARMADLMPGTSGAAFEEQFFGIARTGPSSSTARRYPIIAAKAPAAILRARRLTLREVPGIAARRRSLVAAMRTAAPDEARATLFDASDRMEAALLRHILLTMIALNFYEQVAALCAGAGRPGLELQLMTSRTGTDEFRIVTDAWRLGRGDLELDDFLGEHGYHGPDEGHLSGVVWREDPKPVLELVERYRDLPAESSPEQIAARRGTQIEEARAELLAALPRHRRPTARITLRLATAMPTLRELGKSAFLQIVDVGRAAARALGAHLQRQGVVDSSEDVFFLTLEELRDPSLSYSDIVARRRAEHEYFRTIELPSIWTGMPTPVPVSSTDPDADEVMGLGVSAGVVEGTARVVVDPAESDIEPGEILVCHLTDPSWATMMALAGGLVIDVGSAISHGAIVARELGIPCVINTRTGTKSIRTGDRLRVDGTAGTVELLS